MARNMEIKARLVDRAVVEAAAAALAHGPAVRIRQDDTFFPCADGRLKLREFADGRGELIVYQRPDASGPKASHYDIAPTDAPADLRRVLEQALGAAGRVRKERTLYLIGRARVHLDRVEGLGDFVELEVVLAEGEAEASGLAEARRLMAALCIDESTLVAEAYVDLLSASPDGV
ncbi:class IV adenylate cyclase [Solidesulfovibrio carbinolicus]|uniref:Adenylate cyclase n=1 Tax=Solidesulfovibrio carbinolicus TaxID=296842 RepID=A0A4P6I537_9BACT|nr:class IV adenylate cyclase [Solidesulfovibrio carbinolicus]QAZ69149.1 adenylate cyclase [Solidesulfovibrio carbinolicus]